MAVDDSTAAGVPTAGVPLPLAEERSARLTDVRYDLHFTVPEALDAPVSGRATVRFRLVDATRPLVLDFAGPAESVRDVQVQGRAVTALVRNEHVLIPASALQTGDNEVSLSFDSSDLALNRHPEFMYTLFVPARARLAFPCFDQPDIKARYSLSLQVARDWEAISNGAERARAEQGLGMRVSFAETRPISTYLFAFAAGRFSIEHAERAGRRFRMLHRETDAQKVARNRDAIFDLHATALEWLERYTAIAYPFDKFDFVLIPSFQFGGMEHPGSIYYNAPALLLDPTATQNQKLGRASLIAHETAHMWFGDLVTMTWFNDVWMKEVFANFMAAKIVNPSFPEINHELRFLYAHYPAAYEIDRTPGTNPIRQRLDNLNDAGSLYGAIIYQKAPIVMRQLEMIVGEIALRDGLREYLRHYSFANAAWPDLIRILDRDTADDLETWSRTWVDRPGRPTITADVALRGTTLSLTLTQQANEAGQAPEWTQRLNVVMAVPAGNVTQDLWLRGRDTNLTVPGVDGLPSYVLASGGGIGYGDFVLDDISRAYLTTRLSDVPDPLTRGAAIVTLWEEMLGGRVRPEALFEQLSRSLPRESDELTVARMLQYLQRLFWRFLSAEQRGARSIALETLLRTGLTSAKTPSLKAAWFNALRDLALTPPTLSWLERVWRTRETVPGLTLSEPDFITLALELAVREVPAWQAILDEQPERIANPDRKAQFTFVKPALSADPAVRDGFFAGLREERNRRREAWVLQALGYLHHPLRAERSEQYIPPGLDLLREIQRTGDIFFPKRWLDATLGGHQSTSAAQKVSAFLAGIPKDYPERLRRHVMSSADELLRASRIREHSR